MDKQQKFRRKAAKFESLQQQQQKKRIRRAVFYVILLVSFTALFFILCFAVFFKVKTVNITGNSKYDNQTVLDAAGITVGENLYALSESEIKQKLVTALPYIHDVSVSRSLPSTLNIEISENTAAMYSEYYGDRYLISSDMTVLERSAASPDGLIEVEAGEVKRCFSGDGLTYTDTKMADVVKKLYSVLETYKLADKTTSFSIQDRFDINIVYDNRLEIYFGSIENIDIKVRFFVGILDHIYADDAGKLDISDIKEASFSRKTG